MKPISDFFKVIFGCKLSQVFFAANLAVCLSVFDWNKFFAYLSWLDKIGCKPQPKRLSFGIYDVSGGYSTEFVEGLLAAIFVILLITLAVFLAPSMIVCGAVLDWLKYNFPGLCDETFDLMTVPIFMIVNGAYWILLGCLIEHSHSGIIQNKPTRKNPLSIYPG